MFTKVCPNRLPNRMKAKLPSGTSSLTMKNVSSDYLLLLHNSKHSDIHLMRIIAYTKKCKSLAGLCLMLLFCLFEKPLEFSTESIVIGLQHGAFPHTGCSVDKIAKSNVRLCFTVQSFHVLSVFFLGLSAMEKSRVELFECQVAGSKIAMNYFLYSQNSTFSSSC